MNFDSKLYFSCFLVSDLKEVRESHWNPTLEREKKNLVPIPTIKIVDIGVILFHLIRRFTLDFFFFYLEIA